MFKNRRKFYTRDEPGQFAKRIFNFGDRLVELQERILVDVAATRLQTGSMLNEVNDTLATVCQDRRQILSWHTVTQFDVVS